MGQQVIVQPNGLLCVFSSVTDTIVFANAGPEKIVNWFVRQAEMEARRAALRIVRSVEAGNSLDVYGRRAITYDEAVRKHLKDGGDETMVFRWRR